MGYVNAPFHDEWYLKIQPSDNSEVFSPLKFHPDALKRYHQEWPRGHGKTECTSINYVSWLIGNYPNLHINIITKTSSLAESILTALITRFESDQKYIDIFGELKPRHPKKWTSEQIIVERDEISKNPTIKATGLMGSITGGRSDLNVCDDIIDEENVRTRVQIEKVRTWFHKVLYPTLYPWGATLVIGTRWHYADLYAELLEKWPNDVKQAINKDGSVLWPEYWPLNRLEKRREDIGSIFFNCQYQNDPTGMEGALLKSEWLHSWDEPPSPDLPRYAGVDPALGEGDLQACATLAVGRDKCYLEDVWAQAIPFPRFLRQLKHLNIKHKYVKMFVETNSFQKVLMFIPEMRAMPVVPSPSTRDKESRFIGMSSHFESKRIVVNPLLNSSRHEFWNEWVQFPHGQYDDALDGVEIVTRNVVRGGQPSAIRGVVY